MLEYPTAPPPVKSELTPNALAQLAKMPGVRLSIDDFILTTSDLYSRNSGLQLSYSVYTHLIRFFALKSCKPE